MSAIRVSEVAHRIDAMDCARCQAHGSVLNRDFVNELAREFGLSSIEAKRRYLANFHRKRHPADWASNEYVPFPDPPKPADARKAAVRYQDAQIRREWFPASDDPDRLPRAWLGVDVGFIYPAVDSDGHIYRWASRAERILPRELTRAGPVRIRRVDGTERVFDAYDTDQMSDIMARARDEDYRRRLKFLVSHIISKAKHSDRGLALEDWRDFNRRRTAWTDVWRKLMQLSPEQGVPVRTVKSAYTSQTCPACGHVDRANRPSPDAFRCVACGHTGQSDRIAATNIAAKATLGNVTAESLPSCSNPPCLRAVWRSGLCCSCYFHQRRRGYLPDADDLERYVVARNYREFLAALGS